MLASGGEHCRVSPVLHARWQRNTWHIERGCPPDRRRSQARAGGLLCLLSSGADCPCLSCALAHLSSLELLGKFLRSRRQRHLLLLMVHVHLPGREGRGPHEWGWTKTAVREQGELGVAADCGCVGLCSILMPSVSRFLRVHVPMRSRKATTHESYERCTHARQTDTRTLHYSGSRPTLLHCIAVLNDGRDNIFCV